MSMLYAGLLVAVAAVMLFVLFDAMRTVSRKADWKTPHARLAAEGATLYYLPKPVAAPEAQPRTAVAPAETQALAA